MSNNMMELLPRLTKDEMTWAYLAWLRTVNGKFKEMTELDITPAQIALLPVAKVKLGLEIYFKIPGLNSPGAISLGKKLGLKNCPSATPYSEDARDEAIELGAFACCTMSNGRKSV